MGVLIYLIKTTTLPYKYNLNNPTSFLFALNFFFCIEYLWIEAINKDWVSDKMALAKIKELEKLTSNSNIGSNIRGEH